MTDNPSKTAWEMTEGEPGGNGLWEMAGVGFRPLPPVLRQKFIQSHRAQKNSFAADIRKVAETMQPGEDRGLPFPDEEAAKKALGRIRNVLTRYKPWPEGYSAGIVADEEGHWYASFMRNWHIPTREVEE